MLRCLKVKTILVCVGLCVLAAGCVTTQGVRGPKTQRYVIGGIPDKDLPKWIKNPDEKSTKTQKAFCGKSEKHPSEGIATKFARENAKRQALEDLWGDFIEKKAKKTFVDQGYPEDIITTEIANKQREEWEAAGIVKGDQVEVCSQRIEETLPDSETKVYWQVWVLYMVDRDIAKKALEETLKKAKDSATNAERKAKIDRALELTDKLWQEW